MIISSSLTLMLACAPEVKLGDTADGETADSGTDGGTDGGTTGGTTGGPAGEQVTAILTTTDYSVGSLATVDLATWEVTDGITDTTGDPVVDVSGGYVFQINRFNYDDVRVYEPGSYGAPITEFALDDGANPHDAEVCNGELFLSQFGAPELVIYDPESGLLTGSVDLSAYADADGNPEMSDIVQVDGKLYVALENLDTGGSWTPVGGAVVEIDCATRAVTADWSPGFGVSVFPYPPEPSKVVVSTREDADGGSTGGLWLLDTSDGSLSELLVPDAELGGQVIAFTAYETGAVAMIATPNYTYSYGCIDLSDWSYTEVEADLGYIPAMAGNDWGQAWFAAGNKGVWIYDVETCTSLTGQDPIKLGLGAYSVAFY